MDTNAAAGGTRLRFPHNRGTALHQHPVLVALKMYDSGSRDCKWFSAYVFDNVTF